MEKVEKAMNLKTDYLGLSLPHPLIVGAGPLTDDLDRVRELEDAGAAALTLRSLYEEEIIGEQMSAFFHTDSHAESSAEAGSYFPEDAMPPGPDEYLEHLRRIKEAVQIPVIASLNGVSNNGWTSCARLLQQAGADAVELNLYNSAGDVTTSAAEVESRMVQIVREVKQEVSVPVAAKLSSRFTAFANFATQLDGTGVDGLVLFTRFYRLDIDVLELEVLSTVALSNSADLEVRLKGVALLAGRVNASLAITGGVHTALDVVKATMAGAHATQLVSALLRNGPNYLRTLLKQLAAWMTENEWESLSEMRGNMSFQRIPDPAAYERDTFRKMFGRSY
jgi:dihydroorotate dehydrogenase (fumarate)